MVLGETVLGVDVDDEGVKVLVGFDGMGSLECPGKGIRPLGLIDDGLSIVE